MHNPYETLPIITLFESPEGDEIINQNYRDITLRTLKKILPDEFFEKKENQEAFYQHQIRILQQTIPLITFSTTRNFPGTISFFALSKYRSSSFKFFFEMISRWLVPGKRLNVVLVYASDFRLTYLSDVYTICEVMITVENQAEFEKIQRHYPIISTEISLGMHSEFYAQRILEIKGLTADDKTAQIQGIIAFLVKRFPHAFDDDVFTEMQHILVTCRDEFKAARQSRHLSRIISIQYLLRKSLRESIKSKFNRRRLNLKIFRASIKTPQGSKPVLGILVGINFLRDQESFGKSNLIKAAQYYIPEAIPVENSYFMHRFGSENMCIAYVEIEKESGETFSSEELEKLRKELPANLKNRIEHRLHSVFMPRNEEEVMRNILTLTNQIKFVRDIPQVLINFDEQAYSHLYFTVILARILKPENRSIPELFQAADTCVEYLHDRTKEMGQVGTKNKYKKEATVFRLKLPKEGFLRDDHSIDLSKARQLVVRELSKVVGEIRDYNGGMISKQHETLSSIREHLASLNYDELLLENFFYSLAPVITRSLLDPLSFKKLFLMLIKGLKEYKQEGYYLELSTESLSSYALIIVEDPSVMETLNKVIHKLNIPATELSFAHVKTHGNMCIGYICSVRDLQKQEKFLQAIENTLKTLVFV